MPELVYGLCAVTSFACAALLLRGYRASRARLLLWSALCFLGLAVSDAILLLHALEILTGFEPWRGVAGLVGVSCLLYGLIVETSEPW